MDNIGNFGFITKSGFYILSRYNLAKKVDFLYFGAIFGEFSNAYGYIPSNPPSLRPETSFMGAT